MIRKGVLVALAVTVLTIGGGFVSTPAVASPAAATAGPTPPPLIMILDISGSMDDSADSPNGPVIKLEAAKNAVAGAVRARPAGVDFGVWTYPGSPDCDPGGWLVDVGSPQDPSDALARIDAVGSASGGTPTAEALQAVVEDLKSQGIYEANLILVSDGESNCGDPCETAKNLAGSDFELSINTVGFVISDQGKQELECIAAAGRGEYIGVDDGDELEETIRDLTQPELILEVIADPRPRAGQVSMITAIVRNPSGYLATDVRVELSFGDAGPRTLSPVVVPRTIRMGSLAPGMQARRSWTFVAGTMSRETDAIYTVTAWAGSTGTYQVTGEFTTVAGEYTSTDVGDVLATLGPDRSLVILGDSYSSGEGTGDYLAASTHAADDCHRSRRTYLAPIFDAAGVRVEILACSGAVTSAMTSHQWDGEGWRADRQDVQFAGLSSIPGAVVTTIGGNDIGFESIVTSCVDPRKSECGRDATVRDKLFEYIGQQQDSIEDWYRHAWQLANVDRLVASRDGEYAPVLVLGYPQATTDDKFGACGSVFMSAFEVRYANEVVRALNATIKAAVAAVRADGYEVYYVDRTSRAFQPDHTVCTGDGWINGVDVTISPPRVKPESFHPNAAGYQAMSAAIVGWSRTVERVAPDVDAIARSGYIGEDPGFWSQADSTWANGQSIARVDLDTGSGATLSPRQRIDVSASGFDPGSTVLVWVASESTGLGPVVVGEDGVAHAVVTLPADLESGAHHLVMGGPGADGAYHEASVPVSVVPQFPIWLVRLIMLGWLALIGAAVLRILVRRSRRREQSALAAPRLDPPRELTA